MGKSATERTLAANKAAGRVCGIVERHLAYVGEFGIRKDLFGIIDIIALDREQGVVGIQSTTGSQYAEHFRTITKVRYRETFKWLTTPGTRLELWAWRKVKKKRGGKQMIWKPRIKIITMEDLI